VLKSILRALALGVLSVPMLLMATGCYEKLNGGGWMLSANGADRATFGIHFDGTHSAARGTYHDHGTGVRFKFEGVVDFASEEEGDCAVFIANYKSQDKKEAGSGDVLVIACDEGEPGVNGDFLAIIVGDGPYRGYENEGPILGGNFQGF
jgi:hypothetical protein